MRVEQIGSATLYLGDARDILPTPLSGVDAVVTDPPYDKSVHDGARGRGVPQLAENISSLILIRSTRLHFLRWSGLALPLRPDGL